MSNTLKGDKRYVRLYDIVTKVADIRKQKTRLAQGMGEVEKHERRMTLNTGSSHSLCPREVIQVEANHLNALAKVSDW